MQVGKIEDSLKVSLNPIFSELRHIFRKWGTPFSLIESHLHVERTGLVVDVSFLERLDHFLPRYRVSVASYTGYAMAQVKGRIQLKIEKSGMVSKLRIPQISSFCR